ncbi:hypothetical protein FKW77_004946 [Venturia effusa]|uniref:Anaphase-promoting complex subunit 2 n=1 Tax=Venturia effusa TaxID=50376 RepID=A0A517L7B8_9PEZI|nr:hypothetical protein FKW77_004946 [Venturia effusa]
MVGKGHVSDFTGNTGFGQSITADANDPKSSGMPMSMDGSVFSSVFPAAAALDHTSPTPVATPDLGFSGPGTSFGALTSPNKHGHPSSMSVAQLHVKRNIAWSTATRFLSLNSLTGDELNLACKHGKPQRKKSREAEEAIDFLLSGNGSFGETDVDWNLIEWYTLEVRNHFLEQISPAMEQAWSKEIPCSQASDALKETAQRLAVLQSVYSFFLIEHVLPVLLQKKLLTIRDESARQTTTNQIRRILSKFQRQLHALYVHALPVDRVTNTMSHVMYEAASNMFQLQVEPEVPISLSPSNQRLGRLSSTEKELMTVLRALQEVGLGDSLAQRAFAHAMNKLMGDFIVSHWMKVDWEQQSSVTHKLRRWINHGFSPFCKSVVACLGESPSNPTNHTDADVPQYLQMAIARLGRARIDNLFDYIVQWDVSLGAVLDIKEHITTPEARLYLTNKFSSQVARRLLHAGATTTHILDIYISIIRAFNELDSKGVLLDRVARPIRRYLRNRDDTARIIVSSLLFDVEDENGNENDPGGEISVEIAKEMNKPITDLDEHDYDMDWDNMAWTPDPIDAGPEYKASKTQDVTTALLSLYDKEEFTSELKTILGDHLLRNEEESHYEKEERLLELFKHRLGDDKLQACEVMLRDVQTSKSMNKHIHQDVAYSEAVTGHEGIKLNTQILSRFFWPSLRDDNFAIPAPITELQSQYEKVFESIKDMRKLDWLPALGRVTVELEFEDRKVEEVVPTWTASVIYAFNSDDEKESNAKSVEQLREGLGMEEALVRNALVYWVSKQVLQEVAGLPDTFEVMEKLPTATSSGDDGGAQAAQQAAILDAASGAAGVSAVKSQANILEENSELYRNFILGMLTNGGNMPVPRIEMMLKMMLPGGFPFGTEEIRGLLEGMEAEGKVAGQGGVWGVKKA